MKHTLTAAVVALAMAQSMVAPAIAQGPEDAVSQAAEALKADPNSAEALNTYMNAAIRDILGALESDADAAQAKLEAMKAVIGSVAPTDPEAQERIQQAGQVAPIIEQRISLSRRTLDEIQAALRAAPNDLQALSDFESKLQIELGSKAYSAPSEAATALASARDLVAELKAKADERVRPQYDQLGTLLDQLDEAISSNLAREALIGKDAAPLAVEAWANGSPLSDADLKGKVVLLDFWAVWCGPCIATFPHLIEWNEQYGDKGLVILGLTRYYEFQWDEADGQALPKPGTTPEQERAMLESFAKHHGLTHRFAIMGDDAMSEFYQVAGIPQAVVIDQQGKVRLVRVGSGEANAKAIGDLLAELLGPAEKAAE